jgi:hypothetical protein
MLSVIVLTDTPFKVPSFTKKYILEMNGAQEGSNNSPVTYFMNDNNTEFFILVYGVWKSLQKFSVLDGSPMSHTPNEVIHFDPIERIHCCYLKNVGPACVTVKTLAVRNVEIKLHLFGSSLLHQWKMININLLPNYPSRYISNVEAFLYPDGKQSALYISEFNCIICNN